jgi:uracil phosphoribosyltransferase
MVEDFSKTNSLFSNFMAEIRDEIVQRDRMRFRRNLERISEIMAYELSKSLKFSQKEVTTQLGEYATEVIEDLPVLATILRAGIPMHQGLLNYFDGSDSAFISAYRKHTSEEEFDVFVEYCAAPNIEGKVLIISDPMLATGNSMYLVYKALLKYGTPRQIHIVTAISTQEAIDFIQSKFPSHTKIWTGGVDEELTAQSYIVPGLGDAGDLAFGDKI